MNPRLGENNPRRGERWSDAARRQGREARLEGRPFTTCPYPGSGTLERLWRDGWTREDHALRTGEDA